MAEQIYSEEQVQTAWDAAAVFAGQDPAKYRMDNVNNAGIGIDREKFGKAEKGGWLIDEQGRARHARYKMSEAIAGARHNAQNEESKRNEQRREGFRQQALEAGVPGAWELYERIAELNRIVKQQSAQIQNLERAVARSKNVNR